MATIKDVAKESGVSISTVSCVLNGSKKVRAATRERVLRAVEKLDYYPNSAARSLRSSIVSSIGIVIPNMRNRSYVEMFDSIRTYLQDSGHTGNVVFHNDSPDLERVLVSNFISQNAAGLLIVTCMSQNMSSFYESVIRRHVPVIFLERAPGKIFGGFVGFRVYETFYNIVNSLILKGYRRIGMISGPDIFSPESDARRAYSDAFSSAGLKVEKKLLNECNMTREGAFKTFLSYFYPFTPEVIIATSEEIMLGSLAAINYCGIKVSNGPKIITVIEDSWYNPYAVKQITVIPKSSYYLGEIATKTLLQYLMFPSIYEPSFQEIPMLRSGLPDDFPDINSPKISRLSSGSEFLSRNHGGCVYTGEKTSENSADNVLESDHVYASNSIKTIAEPCLRLIAPDIPSVRALKLMMANFTHVTGIAINITTVSQRELYRMISRDPESLCDTYDLYLFDSPWLEFMVQHLCVADITYLLNDEMNTSYLLPYCLQNCRVMEKYFGVPLIGGTQLLFYRKDFFDDNDFKAQYSQKHDISLRAPRTFKEYNTIARFFTRAFNPLSPTQFGTSLSGSCTQILSPELLIRVWAFSGSLWNSYFMPTFNTKQNYAALESAIQTLDYVPDSPFDTSFEQTIENFCFGKTAMLLTFSEYAQGVSEAVWKNVNGRVGFHTIPGGRPVAAGWNIGLNPFSRHRSDAIAFLKWVCRKDTGYYLTIMNGSSAEAEPYYNHELNRLYPWLIYVEKSLPHTVRRNTPFSKKHLVIPPDEIEEILCDTFRAVIQHGVLLRDALDEAQHKAEKLFVKYGYVLTGTSSP